VVSDAALIHEFPGTPSPSSAFCQAELGLGVPSLIGNRRIGVESGVRLLHGQPELAFRLTEPLCFVERQITNDATAAPHKLRARKHATIDAPDRYAGADAKAWIP
jgi:hypothetical protein